MWRLADQESAVEGGGGSVARGGGSDGGGVVCLGTKVVNAFELCGKRRMVVDGFGGSNLQGSGAYVVMHVDCV